MKNGWNKWQGSRKKAFFKELGTVSHLLSQSSILQRMVSYHNGYLKLLACLLWEMRFKKLGKDFRDENAIYKRFGKKIIHVKTFLSWKYGIENLAKLSYFRKISELKIGEKVKLFSLKMDIINGEVTERKAFSLRERSCIIKKFLRSPVHDNLISAQSALFRTSAICTIYACILHPIRKWWLFGLDAISPTISWICLFQLPVRSFI